MVLPAGEMAGLPLSVLRSRWFMFFGGLLIMSAAGATYLFGVYSPSVKSAYGYTQQELNTMGFFKDLGANVGIIAGLLNEVCPPWVVVSIGAAMNFTGYFMLWLGVTNRIPGTKLWQNCLYVCIGANSQSFANTGVLVSSVKNFPESRGVVLGLLKGLVGLSVAMFTQFYYAIYGRNRPHDLILLIAYLPAIISVVFLPVIRVMKVERSGNELKTFYKFLYIALALAAFLLAILIAERKVDFSPSAYKAVASVVVVILFSSLIVIIREEILKLKESPIPSTTPKLPESVELNSNLPPLSATTRTKTVESKGVIWWIKTTFGRPAEGEDYSILQGLVSLDLWLLFVATVCNQGGILTAMDNMGQIGQALGYPTETVATFLSLASIWNFLGRVGAGFASEIFLAKYKFPRTLMLSIIIFVTCIGHLFIAFPFTGSLYIANVIIGTCFGAQMPIWFAIISEIFGLKRFSTLYNFSNFASPIGSYILNVNVAGKLYDGEALKQMGGVRRSNGELTCTGVECYKLSFIIVAAATFFGFLVSLILYARTRKFYRGDIYAKFRGDAGANPKSNTKHQITNGGHDHQITNGVHS